MQNVPLFGKGLKAKSVNVSVQRRLNMYIEYPDEADKSNFALYPRPGLTQVLTGPHSISVNINPNNGLPAGPWRGVMRSDRRSSGFGGGGALVVTYPDQPYLYAALHAVLLTHTDPGNTAGLAQNGWYSSAAYQADDASSAFSVNSSAGPVVFTALGNCTAAVDGVNGYVADNNGSVTLLGIANFPAGARSICTLASRFITDYPVNPGQFRWSAVNDFSTWSALSFATAETAPDSLSRVYAHQGELLLFGGASLEFWAPTGSTDVFARVGGSGVNWGLAAFDTVSLAGESLYFLGRTAGGNAQVVRLDGHTVTPVSTPDIDVSIASELASNAIANGVVVSAAGHVWYVLNLRTTSWALDINNGTWSEWQTDGMRWAGQYSVLWNNLCYVTDYRDGRVYNFVDGVFLDDTSAIIRQVDTRHLSNSMERMTVFSLALDVESGTGLTTGQGINPQIMLQVSHDGGHTFGNELWTTLGVLGRYLQRVVWRRLGRSRDFVFRLRTSDPVKIVFIGAAINAE